MFKKWDILLTAVLLCLIAAGSLAFLPAEEPGEEAWAVVRIDGAEQGRYPLSRDAVIPVEWEGHRNLLQIRAGKVSVTEANCGNGQCIKMGEKNRAGQMIVCLPHRLVITVEGGASAEGPDVIVR